METKTSGGATAQSNSLYRTILSSATLATTLAALDTKLRYRRTKLGPFWVTASTAAMVLAIGVVYGQLFGVPQDSGNAGYMAFFAAGLIVWQFMSSTLVEGCGVFIANGALIKALKLPLMVHVFRMVTRNVILFAHNIIIVFFLWAFFQWELDYNALLAVPGLALNIIAALGMAFALSVLCTRFRDVQPIVLSSLHLAFLVTPIIWPPSALKETRASFLLDINPLYYLIEVVRSPLLGQPVPTLVWMNATGISLLTLLGGSLLYYRFRTRIAYWL